MKVVSVATVMRLIEQSERNIRRRIADRTLPRAADETGPNRTMVPLDAIREEMVIHVEEEDMDVILQADASNPEAQTHLGLIFLENEKPRGALHWFELAAEQGYAEAMHWIGRAYIDGNGVNKNENMGMMWLAKAAVHGHKISEAQMQAMRDKFTGKT